MKLPDSYLVRIPAREDQQYTEDDLSVLQQWYDIEGSTIESVTCLGKPFLSDKVSIIPILFNDWQYFLSHHNTEFAF